MWHSSSLLFLVCPLHVPLCVSKDASVSLTSRGSNFFLLFSSTVIPFSLETRFSVLIPVMNTFTALTHLLNRVNLSLCFWMAYHWIFAVIQMLSLLLCMSSMNAFSIEKFPMGNIPCWLDQLFSSLMG